MHVFINFYIIKMNIRWSCYRYCKLHKSGCQDVVLKAWKIYVKLSIIIGLDFFLNNFITITNQTVMIFILFVLAFGKLECDSLLIIIVCIQNCINLSTPGRRMCVGVGVSSTTTIHKRTSVPLFLW